MSEKFIDPLEEFLKVKLIPTLTGQTAINNNKYSLLSLPVRFGGMGILNLSAESTSQYNSPLYQLSNYKFILKNPSETPLCMLDLLEEVLKRKKKVKADHLSSISSLVSELNNTSTNHFNLKHCLEAASERGASSWLTCLPIKEHGFALQKGAFRDAICLSYGWTPPHLPTTCICGSEFTIDHSQNCNFGGFPSLHHNDIRDITTY